MRILVTGANRGLGYHLTKLGLENGHSMIAAVRSMQKAEEQLKDLKRIYGNALNFIEMDITSEKSIINAAEQISTKFQSLDVVINNAAVLVERDKTIEELDMEELLFSFEVNTFGPMKVVKHFLPIIKKGYNQAILNISSEAGTILNAFPTNYPYSMSKTALNMFSERLREYLKDKGIRVFAIHPGWMKTDMGGTDAPFYPENTARGIYNIIDNKVNIYSKIAFIDFNGRPMPL